MAPAVPREPYYACEPDAVGQQVSSAMPADLECQGSREGENPPFVNNARAEHISFASGQLSAPDRVSHEAFSGSPGAHMQRACDEPLWRHARFRTPLDRLVCGVCKPELHCCGARLFNHAGRSCFQSASNQSQSCDFGS